MKILDRYVLKELAFPFLFGIAIFTILFMASGPIFEMADYVIKFGVPIFIVMKFALVRIPSFLAYTFPMAVLLATLVAFGRLSADHEIIAMKAGGISFYRIFIPAILFSLLACCLSYLLNGKIGPESLYYSKILVAGAQTRGNFGDLENIKFTSTTNEGLERITIARSFNEQDGIMHGPVVNDYTKDGELKRITHAERAFWRDHAWILSKGETFEFDKGSLQSRMTFDMAEFDLPHTPKEVGLLERSPDEMDNNLLHKTITVMEKDPLKDKNLILSLWVRYRMRQALPFACVIFALVGAPSGIRPVRSSSSVGVAVSVFVILIYYFFFAVCKSFGEHGTVSPIIAAWTPNIAFFLLGTGLLLQEST